VAPEPADSEAGMDAKLAEESAVDEAEAFGRV